MPIYRPKELIEYLKKLDLRPNKRESQNFLIDGNIIKKVVSVAQIQKDDLVIEIGAGPGAITEALIDAGASVIAIEKEKKLADALQELFPNNLLVFSEDILSFPLEDVIIKKSATKKAKIVANIPYHLTGPIISKLLPLNKFISKIFLFVQQEVGSRIAAKVNTREYGSFTVFVNFYSDPKYSFKVSRKSFFPSPKVDSAVIEFNLKEPPNIEKEQEFFKFVKKAFEQRRKMVKNSLEPLYDQNEIIKALASIEKKATIRAESLTLDEFIRLYRRLKM